MAQPRNQYPRLMSHFTPISALLGGVLIGIAASLLLLTDGRIAGISNIFAGVLRPVRGDVAWRLAFLCGLLAAGALGLYFAPEKIAVAPRSIALLAVAGLVVGVGTRLANGCTSGHGVCGVSRLSPRSLIATATFIATGVLTVTLMRVLSGGL
jgi:uncharacterized membrane protein YedE/YeeE